MQLHRTRWKTEPPARGDILPPLKSLHVEEVAKYSHPRLHVMMNYQAKEANDGPPGVGEQLHQA